MDSKNSKKTLNKTKNEQKKIGRSIASVNMKDLMSSEEGKLTVTLPRIGDVLEGKVIAKNNKMLYLDLGTYGTGVIYKSELDSNFYNIKNIEIGDKLPAMVLELENDDGYIELSLKEAGREKAWDGVKEKMEKNEVVKVKILEANRGGLVGRFMGIIGFVPVSQLSQENYPRVEGGDKNKILRELRKFVGKDMELKIINLDPKEEKLIFSEKSAKEDELEESLKKYKIGDIIEGEITGIVDFGAFIKFENNLEGLVHISELDWQLIEDPHDILKIGQKVKAKIIEIENGRVSFSLKQLRKNPWSEVEQVYRKGDVVKGEVIKLNPFGAFVRLDKNIQGLVHISGFKSYKAMEESLEVGKKYKFKILAIKPKEYKLSLQFIQDKDKAKK